MEFLERVIQIDFEDRLGLGMEIFEVCEETLQIKIPVEKEWPTLKKMSLSL